MTARNAATGIRPFLVLAAASALLSTIALSCGPDPSAPELPAAAAVDDEDAPDGSAPVVVVAPPVDRDDDVDGPPDDGDVDEGDIIECEQDRDCQDGSFCNGYEVCGPSQRCVPGRMIECPGVLPFCDEGAETCVCSPGSCPAGTQCDGFGCV